LKSKVTSEIRYLFYGHEIGEQGTPHLQGFLQTFKQLRIPELKKRIHDKIHWESTKGTYDQNIAYCSKEATNIIELGEPMNHGKRTDIDEMKTLFEEVSSKKRKITEILDENPHYVQKYPRVVNYAIQSY